MGSNRLQMLEEKLKKRKIPIVILDHNWHKLFPEHKKSAHIRTLEAEVTKLLKRQGQATNELVEVRKLKGRLMQNIVNNMESTSGAAEIKRGKRLDKSQKLIKEAREKIDDLEFEEATLPQQINDANRELVAAGMDECYERLNENKQEIKEIANWVAMVREELKEKLILKQELEDENSLIYSTMHNMLGREVMEYFDVKYGE